MKSLGTFLFTLLIFVLPQDVMSQEQVVGTWIAEDLDNSLILIFKEEDSYYSGKIIESDNTEYVNQIVLKRIKYNQYKNIWEGKIYSPKRKLEINGTLSLESTDKLKLIGRKYFMTKTFFWTKLE